MAASAFASGHEPTAVAHVPPPRFLRDAEFNLLSAALGLSGRECQIVRKLYDEDEKEAKAARELGMSRHTLRTHVERLYRKLRVTSRAELTVRLYEAYLSLVAEPGSALAPVCGHRAAGRCPLRR